MSKLVFRKHQNELVDFICTAKNTLAWHEVGLGKTLAAVAAARKILAQIRCHSCHLTKSHNPKALVILPTGLVPQWRSEINDHAVDMANQIIYMPYSQLHKAKVLLSYYDIRVIIFDESHYLKTMGTQRLNRLSELLITLADSTTAFRGGRIIYLTATPIPNSAAELYTTWAVLAAPDLREAAARLMNHERYKTWVLCFTNRVLKNIPKNSKTKKSRAYGAPEGVANEDELNKILKPFVHFRTAAQCLDLPKKQQIEIDLGIQDDTLLHEADINKPIEYMALVERLSRAKTPHAIKWIDEFIENNPGERLVVFSHHLSPIKEIFEKFEELCGKVIGGMDIDAKHRSVSAYNTGECPILLATYGAGSVGLNLQKGSNTLYLGYPWSPKIITQAEGRTHRSGQENHTKHFFLMSGQNDKKVLRSLRTKDRGISKVEQGFLLTAEQQNLVDSLI